MSRSSKSPEGLTPPAGIIIMVEGGCAFPLLPGVSKAPLLLLLLVVGPDVAVASSAAESSVESSRGNSKVSGCSNEEKGLAHFEFGRGGRVPPALPMFSFFIAQPQSQCRCSTHSSLMMLLQKAHARLAAGRHGKNKERHPQPTPVSSLPGGTSRCSAAAIPFPKGPPLIFGLSIPFKKRTKHVFFFYIRYRAWLNG